MQMFSPLYREYGALRNALVALTATAIVAAALEGIGLMVLIPILESLVEGSSTVDQSIGPVRVSGSVPRLAGLSALALIGGAAFQIIGSWQRGRMTAQWHHEARVGLLAAHENSSYESQQAEPEGRIIALASSHVGEGANGVRQLGYSMRGLGGVLAFFGGAILIDPLGTFAVVGIGVVLFSVVRPLVKRSKLAAERLSAINLEVATELAGQIEMAADLRVHGTSEPAARRFHELAVQHRRRRVEAMVLVGAGPVIFRTLGILLLVAGVGTAASIGDAPVARIGLVAVLLYRSLSYGQLIQSSWQQLSQVVPYLEDLREVTDRLEAEARPQGTIELASISSVECTDLVYRHPGETHPTIDRLSLRIERGEVVAIIGPSGAGKTTLADLLVGLRSPTSGAVTIDGVGVDEVTPHTRARLIARVSQDVHVMPGTIAANVRFFRDGISDAAIERALYAVGLAELFCDNNNGIESPLGNSDRHLSGGQRQRLGIARAIVGAPDLVILDEPTSALDSENEDLVAQLIKSLRDTAAVVVAHRPATIAAADRVIELRRGRIWTPSDRIDLAASQPPVPEPFHS